ncbi:MAG: hypothetical protein ACI9D5_001080 [Candidatus Endobugula sp.]
MFLVSISYEKELSEVDQIIDDHVVYLKKYYALGNFLLSGRKVPRTGGVILVKASSREELNAIVAEDPFTIAGVASYTVIEFVPTMSAKECEFFP